MKNKRPLYEIPEKLNINKNSFVPNIDTNDREKLLKGWKKAVNASQIFVGE